MSKVDIHGKSLPALMKEQVAAGNLILNRVFGEGYGVADHVMHELAETLKLPWDEPTMEEAKESFRVPLVDDIVTRDLRLFLARFVRLRNAAMLPSLPALPPARSLPPTYCTPGTRHPFNPDHRGCPGCEPEPAVPCEQMKASECRQEVFTGKYGATKAVVCSCGFATTYTVYGPGADDLGMKHFLNMHEAYPHPALPKTVDPWRTALKKKIKAALYRSIDPWGLSSDEIADKILAALDETKP